MPYTCGAWGAKILPYDEGTTKRKMVDSLPPAATSMAKRPRTSSEERPSVVSPAPAIRAQESVKRLSTASLIDSWAYRELMVRAHGRIGPQVNTEGKRDSSLETYTKCEFFVR